MKDNKLVFRTSRRCFLHTYLGLGALTAALFIANAKDMFTDLYITAALYGLIVLGVIIPELERMALKIEINPNGVVMEKGLLKKHHTTVFKDIITDIHVKQNYLQRLFRFGNLSISSFSQGGLNLSITINNPYSYLPNIRRLLNKQ
jgi:membrane protein YdbS with pleckstrin-like domain